MNETKNKQNLDVGRSIHATHWGGGVKRFHTQRNIVCYRFISHSSQVSPYHIKVIWFSLQWRHNVHDGVSNHQPHHCLLNRFSSADQRKHQSSASLAFVWGLHRWPVNSPCEWPVTRKNISIWWRHHVIYMCVRVIGYHWDGRYGLWCLRKVVKLTLALSDANLCPECYDRQKIVSFMEKVDFLWYWYGYGATKRVT